MAGPKTLNLKIYRGEKPYSVDLTFAGYNFAGCTGVAQVKDRSGALLFALTVTFPAADKCRISYADTTPLPSVRGAVWDLFITYSGGVIRNEVTGFVYVLIAGQTAPKSCDTALTGSTVTITAAQQGPPGASPSQAAIDAAIAAHNANANAHPGLGGGTSGTASGPVIAATSHGFSPRQSLYMNSSGAFALAKNDAEATLGRYLIASIVDVNTFTLALPGQLVDGFTGLVPGGWYHCSPATAGAIVQVSLPDRKPSNGYAANQIGQALTSTSLIYSGNIPYLV